MTVPIPRDVFEDRRFEHVGDREIYALIETAKLNDIDPQAWLADVLARLPDHPAKRIDQLLPWNWRPQNLAAQAA